MNSSLQLRFFPKGFHLSFYTFFLCFLGSLFALAFSEPSFGSIIMSKKSFKSQASSSRAITGAVGGFSDSGVPEVSFHGFGRVVSSPLSHVYEPPDLNKLSDPNIVVAFKNLQKRDSTTKSKALDDIQAYVQPLSGSQDALEETLLETWVRPA